jgi:RNase adapter protein RapZ
VSDGALTDGAGGAVSTARGGAIAGSDPPGIEVTLVSGLSGAGRSTAAKVLEDLGWFVVDNLPPELIATMVDLGARARGEITRIAVVMDVRSRAFTADLGAVIKDLDARGYKPRLLFLEASDAVLVRRFEQVRRSHPLQGDGRLIDGIAAERELLRPLRENADLVVDTSTVAVPQLRATLERAFGTEAAQVTRVTLVSFGYKYGLPMDSDLVMDVRFLPNPFWIPELREQTGLDGDVRNYVLTQEGAEEFLDRYHELLRLIGAGYRREGKRYLTLAVGCTGGKHRSVAISEELAGRLASEDGMAVKVVHRDLGRE